MAAINIRANCAQSGATTHKVSLKQRQYRPIVNETKTNHYYTMFSLIGYGLYGLGIVDFAGMFFGYDLTGVSWSPIAFWAAGYGLQALQMAIDGKN